MAEDSGIPTFGSGELVFTLGVGCLSGYHIRVRADSRVELDEFMQSAAAYGELTDWDRVMADRLVMERYRILSIDDAES